ncbi:MAG: methyltransferase domain-containing protein [Gammaproteobacteria bacterium]|nr:methyltransferase domain-containing protein [Gammaproteobacteria bacterium]
MISSGKYSNHRTCLAITFGLKKDILVIYQHFNAKLVAYLEKIEKEFIEQFSSCHAIGNALLIGNSRQSHLLKGCHCQHRYLFCENYPKSHPQISPICLGHFTELPYAKESIDLVILPHVLEFSNRPKEMLGQIFNTLSKRGALLLFSFLPSTRFSLANKNTPPPFLSPHAIKQLLTQVGLEIIATQSFFSPLTHTLENKFMKLIDAAIASYLPFLCKANLIVAQKTSIPATPIPLKSFAIPTIMTALEGGCRNQLGNP